METCRRKNHDLENQHEIKKIANSKHVLGSLHVSIAMLGVGTFASETNAAPWTKYTL